MPKGKKTFVVTVHLFEGGPIDQDVNGTEDQIHEMISMMRGQGIRSEGTYYPPSAIKKVTYRLKT